MSSRDESTEEGIIVGVRSLLLRRSNNLVLRGVQDFSLLSENAKPETLAEIGSIFQAIQDGDIGKVRTILAIDPSKANDFDEKGKDIRSRWRTPLDLAAEQGCLPVVEILLEYGADVDSKPAPELLSFRKYCGRMTPLMFAAEQAHVRVLELLVRRGADVNAMTSVNWTALHSIATRGCVDGARILINHGAQIGIKTWFDESERLVGMNNCVDPIHIASDFGHVLLVEYLITQGADVNATTERGETPLHIAARKGHIEIIRILLNHGATQDLRDFEGMTPLDRARNLSMQDAVDEFICHQMGNTKTQLTKILSPKE